jgi:AcrR family transcriptional regulator
MVESISRKRSYHSALRQESAQQTRQAIARAALQLFQARGYRGASVEAIAGEAGVAPETIYAAFGNKRELLHYLLDTAVGGDEAPVRILDRPDRVAMLALPDARAIIATFSAGYYPVMRRAAPVFAILAEAAKTEPALAELQAHVQAERFTNMGRIIAAIAAAAPLRLDPNQAAETLWALTAPELFLQLTVTRGWEEEKLVAWLVDSLVRLLLEEKN